MCKMHKRVTGKTTLAREIVRHLTSEDVSPADATAFCSDPEEYGDVRQTFAGFDEAACARNAAAETTCPAS